MNDTTQQSAQWVSIDDAAALLGVSSKTIRRRIADGTVAAVRFGPRLIRVNIDAIENAGRPIARTVVDHAAFAANGVRPSTKAEQDRIRADLSLN